MASLQPLCCHCVETAQALSWAASWSLARQAMREERHHRRRPASSLIWPAWAAGLTTQAFSGLRRGARGPPRSPPRPGPRPPVPAATAICHRPQPRLSGKRCSSHDQGRGRLFLLRLRARGMYGMYVTGLGGKRCIASRRGRRAPRGLAVGRGVGCVGAIRRSATRLPAGRFLFARTLSSW